MQFFAQKGLATPIDDVWKTLTPQIPPAMQGGLDRRSTGTSTSCRSTTTRGRSSTGRASSKEKGYTVPKTWDQFIALAKKMKADGLTPIAFTDKDGWPAMGTFDILNMRINGYEFHVDLMAGKESWDSPKVKAVFNQWTRAPAVLLATVRSGLTWQDGAQQLVNKQAGMFLLGSFVGQQATKPGRPSRHRLLPVSRSINPKWGQDSIDAPIDGYMMSKSRRTSTARRSCSGSSARAAAANTYLKIDSNDVGARTSTRARAHYSALQKKAAKLIARRQAHRAVHGPRHAARLRLDGDDPVAAAFLNKPERRQQARQEHREAEEGDLRH